LPVKGFVDRSDKYVLGPVVLNEFFPIAEKDDWLGFYAGAEAEVAKYRVNGRELTLVLADFPTPQSAQKRLSDIQRDLHVNPTDDNATQQPIFPERAIRRKRTRCWIRFSRARKSRGTSRRSNSRSRRSEE
jgi:hypothetical protein